MSQTPDGARASGLLRVTVASSTRRVDLVLPGTVPVAELVPELARNVGLLDGSTVHGGYHLLMADGRRLAGDTGLLLQGVEDGGLLTVTAGVHDVPPTVYDDVVEAMTDVVERELRPWQPAAGRRTALGSAALLLTLGAAAAGVAGGTWATALTALVAAALVVGAIVLSRAPRESDAAVAVAWMGCAYAAVAGALAAPAHSGLDGLLGEPAAYAGGATLVAGLLALLGLGEGRALMLPPVLAGAVFGAVGLLGPATDLEPTAVLTVVLVLVVLAGSVFPWLALGATGARLDPTASGADVPAIDPRAVAADARTAHEILVALSGVVGLLLVLIAPLTVSRGLAGTLLAVVCCLAVMLRTRQYRTGAEVLVGLVSGVLGLAVTAAAAVWGHPDWRPILAVVLAATGLVVLVLTLLPSTPSVRRGRLGDLAEAAALLALLPLTVVAIGLFSEIRG